MLKKVIVFYFTIFMSTTYAHEFWLQPNTYTAAENEVIQVNWRVGMEFQGQSSVYIPDMSSYVGTHKEGQLTELNPRFAAKPTLTFNTGPGTTIGVTESADFIVEYKSYDAFFVFIKKENLFDQLIEPTEPPSGKIFESYRRFTKTLISTEAHAWQDSEIGLNFEWLLTRDGDNLRGTLLINSKPAANYPVKLFAKPAQNSSEVSVQKITTDSNGTVLFTNLEKNYIYLINAIKLRPSAQGDKFNEALWHSDWASTTFQW